MSDLLFNLYKDQLGVKNIHNESSLDKIIAIDREKVLQALDELQHKSTKDLANDFFNGDPKHVKNVLAEISHPFLYHIGMEINCPLEIALYGFKQDVAYFNEHLNDSLEVTRVLIFSASDAFQNRVNAYTGVMRIWLKMRHGEYMLELFDIHRSIDLDKLIAQHQQSIYDDIWHYAMYINYADQVKWLHEYCQIIVEKNPTYELPFKSVINNKNDGSVLTKIINRSKKIEIEFVTGTFVTGPIPSSSFGSTP
ncbi:MAG: hypothetical protein KAG06_05955 [Methylococcales bacterium]|nr:hypothetical protein [Methylococcales bacterium]